MKKLLISISGLLPLFANAGLSFSYSEEVIELGYSVDIKDNSYLYVGADTSNWFAVGYGYSHLFDSYTRISGYYEFAQWDNMLLGDFGVKTNSNLFDLSVSQFFINSSIKLGGKYEHIDDNGWEFEAGDKRSIYTGYSYYFDKWYVSATYTHSLRTFSDEFWGDSDSDFRSDEIELTVGTGNIWKISPYLKTTAYKTKGQELHYNWSMGGSFTW